MYYKSIYAIKKTICFLYLSANTLFVIILHVLVNYNGKTHVNSPGNLSVPIFEVLLYLFIQVSKSIAM